MSASGDPPRPRQGVAPRWVLLGLALSFLVAFLIAVYLYRRYVAFERRAAEHLVAEPALVVRVDLEHVSLYAPFHEHLMPLVIWGQPEAPMKPRLTRLKQHSGIEVGVDIRELVFSRGASSGAWAIAVSGMFPPQGVVEGIGAAIREEGNEAAFDAGLARLRFGNGVLLQQAADSVLVFASDARTLNQALGPTERYEALGLGKAKPSLSVVVRAALLAGPAGGEPPHEVGGFASGFQLNASLDKSTPDQLTLELRTPADAEPPASTVHLVAKTLGVPEASVRFVVSGPNQRRAQLQVSGKNLARAADQLARGLREAAFSAP